MQKAEQVELLPFDASDWKIGIVVAQFNQHITGELYQNALKRAAEYELKPQNIITAQVAGAGEIPIVLQKLAEAGTYHALMAIGCVIRGETAHFEYVCKFVTEGVLRVQLDHKQPIAFGVLMCNSEAEAKARTGLAADHLDAVMHQAKILQTL
jgi:6,7-dimethyl-8-ribityllumazine synthase